MTPLRAETRLAAICHAIDDRVRPRPRQGARRNNTVSQDARANTRCARAERWTRLGAKRARHALHSEEPRALARLPDERDGACTCSIRTLNGAIPA